MNKKYVKRAMNWAFPFLVALLIFMTFSCSSEDSSAPDKLKAQAELDWQEIGSEAQNAVCELYDTYGGDPDQFLEMLMYGEDGLAEDVALAHISIMEDNC